MEVVTPIGFAISVVQARSILSSIKTRIENYRKGPATFHALNSNVERLDRQIVRTEQLLEKFPHALPSDISGIFYEEFASVGDNLEDALSTMERSLESFAGSSSVMGNLSSKRRRTMQATALAAEMDNMKSKIVRASDQLNRLISVFSNALVANELRDFVTSKIENVLPLSLVPHTTSSRSTVNRSSYSDTAVRTAFSAMEVVAPIGFAISVVQARSILSSIKTRIENYRKGPATFHALNSNVERLDRQIVGTEQLLEKFPHALPSDISGIFYEEFASVGDNLEDALSTMERSLESPFAGSSSVMGNLSSKSRRTMQATALAAEMDNMKLKIDRASDQLNHLISVFSNALVANELRDFVVSKFDNVFTGIQDVFRPRTNTPALSAAVALDFDAQDAHGRPVSPEGILKQSILPYSASSCTNAVAGVIKSSCSIVGMPGVGKTVALQGLAHDTDIRNRFPDGVFFMALGQGATLEYVLDELTKILVVTGGSKIAAYLHICTSLLEAVNFAAPWFEKRSCLFLVDDVWPTESCRTGFLTDFSQILRKSLESRIAFSTRSTTIGRCAELILNFGAREPLGSTSMKIFMAHAKSSAIGGAYAELGSNPGSSVLKIQSICAGLPLALAVTGTYVSFLSSACGDFESACESYAARLEKERSLLGDMATLGGASLNACILLSLRSLEVEFLKWKAKHSLSMENSVSGLYTSLCVLERQPWVSVSALGQLWGVDKDAAMDAMKLFSGMSLATLSMGRRQNEFCTEDGIMLHPLLLEFCRRMGNPSFPQGTGSWRPCITGKLKVISSESGRSDGYNNHLIRNKEVFGCSAVVTTPGHERIIYAARKTLHIFRFIDNEKESEFASYDNSDSDSSCESPCNRSLELSKFSSDKFYFTTLSYARNARRLVSGSDDGKVQVWNADTLRRIGEAPTDHTECLLSVAISSNGAYVIAGTRRGTLNIWECEGNQHTRVLNRECGHAIRSVCISGTGRRAMSSAGSTISVWSPKTMEEKDVLEADSHEVFSLDVSENGKYFVAGSRNGSLRLWNWKKRKSQCIFTFSGIVSSVSLNGDGRRLAASSMDGTTRIFNLSTRAETGAPIRHAAGDGPSVALNDSGSRLVVSTCENIAEWAVGQSNDDVDQVAEEITTLNIT